VLVINTYLVACTKSKMGNHGWIVTSSKSSALSMGLVNLMSHQCVRTEDLVQDLGVNDQYKKTYKGPSLIRDNPDTTHRMATRSHKHMPPKAILD
jgi:hypothetical protein